MFFRNLTFFAFPPLSQLHDPDAFESDLDQCQLRPVGPLELASRGFVSPLGRDFNHLSHRIDYGTAIWVSVGGEDKILPPAVVNDLLAKRLREIEKKEGRRPGGRTRKRLKDELITDLLPRALVRPSRTDAHIDTSRGVVIIDTSSRKVAETVCSEVRRALGSFPALPLNAEVAPRAVLTGWLAGEPMPQGLSIGDECELRDPIGQGAVVKIQRDELFGEEVAKHLESGKQCTRLALTLNDHVSFVFGEDLVVRKFKLLDGAVEALDSLDADSQWDELEGRFALQIGEVRQLFDVLRSAFKFSDAGGVSPPPMSPPPASPTSASQRREHDRGAQEPA